MNTLFKELRLEKGLTLKEVAGAIGITLSAYSNYEQGLREPSLSILKRICEYFEVSADYFLELETDIGTKLYTNAPAKILSNKEKSPTVELTAEEKELLDNYRQLPKDLKHRAEAYMEKLVEVLNEEDVRPISAPSNPSSQTPRSTLRITRRR